MALIECSTCNKRISSKASHCQYCGCHVSEDTELVSKISHIKRSNQLINHGLLSMSVFIAGVVVWCWGGESAQGLRAYIGSACFVVGFVGYLITRLRIVIHKRKKV
ncbi:zinc ribbon domain-containing protein [Shewanella sp. VB17]|uniref:zinc ribbon domain-containing protein n=1 Tax=Shewanella sp. VB17 TaxID=2739432 RepID=UPI001563B52D|nr:zinc ribbon domain-containing protein [Shewanella sp. VB17]NRD73864.1 zinc ribbon domain-containing protein [Shewanella sp. VB17]